MKPVFGVCVMACLLSGGAWAADFNQTGFEDFTHGTPGCEVPGWTTMPDFVHSIHLQYADMDSYAQITLTALAGEKGIGTVYSPWITRDVDVDNTLEIRIQNLSYQTDASWMPRLNVATGLPDQPYVVKNLLPNYDRAGATGIFTYTLNSSSTGLSGKTTFQIQIESKLNTANALTGYILLDYVRIYPRTNYQSGEYLKNGARKQYVDLWKEDFVGGKPGASVDKWRDDPDEDTLDGEIIYQASGARIRMLDMTVPSSPHSYKVISPGVYLDPAQYPLIRGELTAISPGTRCIIAVLEIGRPDKEPWQSVEVGSVDSPREWVFDVRNVPKWLWPKERILAIEFFIESSTPSNGVDSPYYDLAYVAMSKEILPATLTDKVKTYATPNPFFPLRGQTVTFQADVSDPTANFTIRVYNLKGQLVRQLEHQNVWDGRDTSGNLCEGGVYVYQLEKTGVRFSGQVVLVR